jgi:hypothetical protein
MNTLMKMFSRAGLPTEFGSAKPKPPSDSVQATGTVTDAPLPATGTVSDAEADAAFESLRDAAQNTLCMEHGHLPRAYDVAEEDCTIDILNTPEVRVISHGIGNRPEDATGAENLPESLRSHSMPKIDDKPEPGYTRWDVEETDTFGDKWSGNYCWVNRHTFDMPDDAPDVSVVRKAKELVGLTGVKCDKQDAGDTIMLSPRNNTVVFITPRF